MTKLNVEFFHTSGLCHSAAHAHMGAFVQVGLQLSDFNEHH